MNELPLLPEVPSEQKRSQLLTVLCILTFIWSGLNIFSYLSVAVFLDSFRIIAQEAWKQFNLPEVEIWMNAPPGFFLLTGLFFGGSLAGALLMWRQRKVGFHVYTIAQILMLIAPIYFLNLAGPSVPEVIFSGLFIILYSTQLKLMH